MTPISRVRSEMDIIMVFVIPRAATKREMAPRQPSMSCFCLASCSIGRRMLSMELVENPIFLICVSISATCRMVSAFTMAFSQP